MTEFAELRSPITSFVVVVPAHDEVDVLPEALASITMAAAAVTAAVRVVVVLDDCTDGTANVIPSGVEVRVISARNVGRARRAGFAGHEVGEDIWFATTDADSRVPTDWLAVQSRLASAGADAIAGTITPDDWASWPPEAASRFAARYTDRDGHRHVHGANLGVRSSVYAAVGGFTPLDQHEDVDLIARVGDAGAHVAWTAQAPVRTSTRRTGRTPGGFAGRLAELFEPAAALADPVLR